VTGVGREMEEGLGNDRGTSSLFVGLLSDFGALDESPGSDPYPYPNPGPGRLMRDGSEGLAGRPDPNL
jgi:hypothetical protein